LSGSRTHPSGPKRLGVVDQVISTEAVLVI
jgi:hypothetical protein